MGIPEDWQCHRTWDRAGFFSFAMTDYFAYRWRDGGLLQSEVNDDGE